MLDNTRECHEILKIGDTIGEYTVSGMPDPNPAAMMTSDTELTIPMHVTISGQSYTHWARKYNLETSQFDDGIVPLTLKVGDNTYHFCAEDQDSIISATGCETFSYASSTTIMHSYTPIRVGDVYYLVFNVGYFSHILIKSTDCINWEFVSDVPIGDPTEEVDICYSNNRIYATCRGNNERGGDEQWTGYSKILYYDMGSKTWSTPISLEPHVGERPTIASFNDMIFVVQGTMNGYVNGRGLSRQGKELLTFDANLNLVRVESFRTNDGNLHPIFRSYGTTIFSLASTDRRCMTYYSYGENRSDLVFSKLDMDIFTL